MKLTKKQIKSVVWAQCVLDTSPNLDYLKCYYVEDNEPVIELQIIQPTNVNEGFSIIDYNNIEQLVLNSENLYSMINAVVEEHKTSYLNEDDVETNVFNGKNLVLDLLVSLAEKVKNPIKSEEYEVLAKSNTSWKQYWEK